MHWMGENIYKLYLIGIKIQNIYILQLNNNKKELKIAKEQFSKEDNVQQIQEKKLSIVSH